LEIYMRRTFEGGFLGELRKIIWSDLDPTQARRPTPAPEVHPLRGPPLSINEHRTCYAHTACGGITWYHIGWPWGCTGRFLGGVRTVGGEPPISRLKKPTSKTYCVGCIVGRK
jgi:hypothetical protein